MVKRIIFLILIALLLIGSFSCHRDTCPSTNIQTTTK